MKETYQSGTYDFLSVIQSNYGIFRMVSETTGNIG